MRGASPRQPIPPPLMGGGQGEGELRAAAIPPAPCLFPPGAQRKSLRPFGGGKVHRTFPFSASPPVKGEGELDKGFIYR